MSDSSTDGLALDIEAEAHRERVAQEEEEEALLEGAEAFGEDNDEMEEDIFEEEDSTGGDAFGKECSGKRQCALDWFEFVESWKQRYSPSCRPTRRLRSWNRK